MTRSTLKYEIQKTEIEKKALRCKTHGVIMALYRNDHKTVNESKPFTLSPMIDANNTVISEFDHVHGRFDMHLRENSADGLQSTNHKKLVQMEQQIP